MMRNLGSLCLAFEVVAETFAATLLRSGGEYDRELAEATAVVERVFPGAQLVRLTQ